MGQTQSSSTVQWRPWPSSGHAGARLDPPRATSNQSWRNWDPWHPRRDTHQTVTSLHEVPVARPSPSMIFLNMIRMDIWTPKAVVKVDDTGSGIVAGLHAGCWTVGIAKTGNYVGATEKQLAAMPKAELEAKVQAARKKLYDSGAHYVIDTVSDLPAVVDKINERLAMGLSP